jgi:hypothetical protein
MPAQAQAVPASTRAFFPMRFDMPTDQEDIAYYRRRAAEAEAQAAAAACPSARRAHEARARLYIERLWTLEGGEPAPLQGYANGVPSA